MYFAALQLWPHVHMWGPISQGLYECLWKQTIFIYKCTFEITVDELIHQIQWNIPTFASMQIGYPVPDEVLFHPSIEEAPNAWKIDFVINRAP